MKQIKCYCGHTTYCDCSPLETKQTAVENIIEQQRNLLNDLKFGAIEIDEYEYFLFLVFDKAKAMEKEQIMMAIYDSMGTNFDPNMGRAEQYYNETYGDNK